tara:strand:+ start:21901 stop:23388 length:1488 start_codon:yes stop_codon:yes gene_type:complete
MKIDLLKFKHFREDDFQITSDKIYNLINDFSESEQLSGFYNYFRKKYDLPEHVIKQTLKQYLAKSYLFKSSRFKENLKLKKIPMSIFKYSSLIYGLFFFKRSIKIKKFKIIIDYLASSSELKRFTKLINLFGSKNVLCILRNVEIKEDENLNYTTYNIKNFRDLNILYLIKSIFYELSYGIWLVIYISFKNRVNLLPISLRIIHDYLAFKSLFNSYYAKLLLQEKHYNTEPIKNYLFKKSGGVLTSSLQKNIIQSDPIFFYIDIDTLFTLGESGYERIFNYGGKIKNIKPVGSLFMEYYWFDNKKEIKKKFDIVIIGINTSNAYERLDSYNSFMEDYYSLYNWAAKFSKENLDLNIALIHHASSGRDIIEENILKDSNITVLNKNLNSYEVVFSSKIAITYGSTMGYELNGHNFPTFFVDPELRCSFLPKYGENCIDKMRLKTYKDFKNILKNAIENRENYIFTKLNQNKFCMNSMNVSNQIYNYLIEKAELRNY